MINNDNKRQMECKFQLLVTPKKSQGKLGEITFQKKGGP